MKADDMARALVQRYPIFTEEQALQLIKARLNELIKKGWLWGRNKTNHKYIKREGGPGGYRYFYADDIKFAHGNRLTQDEHLELNQHHGKQMMDHREKDPEKAAFHSMAADYHLDMALTGDSEKHKKLREKAHKMGLTKEDFEEHKPKERPILNEERHGTLTIDDPREDKKKKQHSSYDDTGMFEIHG